MCDTQQYKYLNSSTFPNIHLYGKIMENSKNNSDNYKFYSTSIKVINLSNNNYAVGQKLSNNKIAHITYGNINFRG